MCPRAEDLCPPAGPGYAELLAQLPAHLREFAAQQDYAGYNAGEHAAWRFLMRRLTRQLRASAHPVYLEGLARTGISLEHIPSIDEMNAALAQLGWSAVVVDGFIPPAIFMEFQARRVLPIALRMRSAEHLYYTPAPDILHESAGHAPFIVDTDYAEYLQRFGEVGMKAIASTGDMAQYEAIRRLSVLKESNSSTADEVAAAEAELQRATNALGEPSEAALLSRLHWWTVEYGLVGELDDYRIFGAGLLSSLGESRHCLDDTRVKKLLLTVDAVNYPYDITREQPQLFVTRNCRHLSQVLEQFAEGMSFRLGGAASLRRAMDAGTVCTAQFDNGLQLSGVFTQVLCDAMDNPVFLRTTGPTQLACHDHQLDAHGAHNHPDGIAMPLGPLLGFERCLSCYHIDELRERGIASGETVALEFLSGITVRGRLRRIERQGQRNRVLAFEHCSVTDRRGMPLVECGDGRFELPVGGVVTSVFGGAADREHMRLYGTAA